MDLDKKDCLILNMLQKNCRTSLTSISKKVNLSVDTVKRRIQTMIDNDVFFPKIQLRPRHFGYKNIFEVKVKLKEFNDKDITQFIGFLKNNPYVVEIIKIAGPWNYTLVLIAKDAIHQGEITDEIKTKFSKIIDSWIESLTTSVYKWEEYEMINLVKNDK
jgi:DNA-binding Lrp family transcriptional regulator